MDEEEVYSGATKVISKEGGLEGEFRDGSGTGLENREEVKRTEFKIERDMEEIEREIREAREGARLEEVVVVFDTDVEEGEQQEREQHERETEEQILSASRRRRRVLLEESEEEEGEEVPFRPIDEVPSPRQPEREEKMSMAELERIQRDKKRKMKHVALSPKKKFRPAATTVRIQEMQTKGAATQQQTESEDEEKSRREKRSKYRQDSHQRGERRREEAVAPTYPKVQV